jgi:transcriptional regulator with GAF, ATPase, and Fis domain
VLLDRYVPEGRLGEGASSVVYAARDAWRSGHTVALKIAKQPSHNRHLDREYALLSRVYHPHIGVLLAHGKLAAAYEEHAAGATVLVQQRVAGVSTDAWRPPAAEAVRAAMQLAAALATLHSHGLRHGDLKPANVLRTSEGVSLIDFGCAALAGDPSSAGTPRYMAPEALAGKQQAASDVYALGLTLARYLGAEPHGDLGAQQQAPVHGDVVAALTHPDPERRPNAVAAFEMLGGDPQMRDLGAPAQGFIGQPHVTAAVDAALAEFVRGNAVALCIGGGAGCGRTEALREVERRAALLGIAVHRASAPSPPFRDALVRMQGGVWVADDVEDALFARFVARAGVPLLWVQTGTRGDVQLLPLDAAGTRKLVALARPLRPEDAIVAGELWRVTGGHQKTLAHHLEVLKGDLLQRALRTGWPAGPGLLPDAELGEFLAGLAWLEQPVPRARLEALFPGAPIDAALAAGLVTLLPGPALSLRRDLCPALRERLLEPARSALAAQLQRRTDGSPAEVGLLKGDAALVTEGARQSQSLQRRAELLAAAIAIESTPDRRAELAATLLRLGRADDGLRTLRADDAPGIRCELLLRLGRYGEAAQVAPSDVLAARALLLGGRYEAAATRAQEGLKRQDDARLHAALGLVAFYAGRSQEALSHLERAAEAATDEHRAEILGNLALVLQKAGRLVDAEARYLEAAAHARSQDDLPRQVSTSMNQATLEQDRGDVAAAARRYEEALRLARLLDGDQHFVRVAANYGNLRVFLGVPDGRVLEEALALAGDMPAEASILRLVAAEAALAAGDAAAADLHQRAAQALYKARGDRGGDAECTNVAAEIALFRRDFKAAQRLATDACSGAALAGRERVRLHALTWYALALAQMANASRDQWQMAAEGAALADKLDSPDPGWLIHASLAQLGTRLGNAVEADLHRDKARTALASARARVGARYEQSYLDVWYRRGLAATLVQEDRPRNLERVLTLNRDLVQDHNPERLLDRILDAAIELSGAERGLLILNRDGRPEVTTARNLDREALDAEGAHISQSIASKVIAEGTLVSSLDAQDDTRFVSAESVHELHLRSILCLPLAVRGEILGALYLDHRGRANAFADRDVPILSAFADQAGIALANARMIRDLEARTRELEHSRRDIDALNQRLQRELSLRPLPAPATALHNAMVGKSAAMRSVFKTIERVAVHDVSVAILGESGTGKELVARAIHAQSGRASAAFVPVNCGAIPEELMESELFGHERGAFTGAVRTKEGLFQVADAGTLFLDEIGDMPLSMQVKLLRVLQQREFRRVGATETLACNVRVLAATNRDLEARVREGLFREDLWYRLNVVTIELPPLRARRDDLPDLITHLLQKHGGPRPPGLTPQARARLLDYDWPGNVRELENELQRALALAEGSIGADVLSARLGGGKPEALLQGTLKDAVDRYERDAIAQFLERARHNVSQAARDMGLTRPGLYKKLSRHGIHVPRSG